MTTEILLKEKRKELRRIKTTSREIEMTADPYFEMGGANSRGANLQFHHDIQLYGMHEALLYAKAFVEPTKYDEFVKKILAITIK